MSTQPNEREAFEAAMAREGYRLDPKVYRDGTYRDSEYVAGWAMWQARAALSTPPAAVPAQAYAARYQADPSQAKQVETYTDGWNDHVPQCAGMSCGTTTAQHSRECIAEHAAAVAGGKFVKVPAHMALVPMEPTSEQVRAVFEEHGTSLVTDHYARAIYRTMVAAALQGDGNADQAGK
jgi:hypothetical protein